jgi:hypothetical protein
MEGTNLTKERGLPTIATSKRALFRRLMVKMIVLEDGRPFDPFSQRVRRRETARE